MTDPDKAKSKGRRWTVSVFGDITQRGSWPAQERMTPVAVLGDIDLDFRDAAVPAGPVAISAVAPFGNIDVMVPAGVNVDVGGFTLFGSKKLAVARRDRDRLRARCPRSGLQRLREREGELVTVVGTSVRRRRD